MHLEHFLSVHWILPVLLPANKQSSSRIMKICISPYLYRLTDKILL